MAGIDLSKYGITGATEIIHNPSYELLFEEETSSKNEGYEIGKESELGAVNVMTGIYTGRSLRISTSLLMKILRTLYGGHLTNTRTITTQCQKMYGLRLRILQRANFLTRDFS